MIHPFEYEKSTLKSLSEALRYIPILLIFSVLDLRNIRMKSNKQDGESANASLSSNETIPI